MRFLPLVILMTCLACQPSQISPAPAQEKEIKAEKPEPEPPAPEPNGTLTLVERGKYLAKFDGNLSNIRMSVRVVRMTNGFTNEKGSGVEFTIGRKGADGLLGSALFVDTELDELLHAMDYLVNFDQRATLEFSEATYRSGELSIFGYERANDQLGFVAALDDNSVLLTAEQLSKLADDVRVARDQLREL